MSLISYGYQENSDSIAKDYASIVAEKVSTADSGSTAPTLPDSVRVSIENLYRLLEMFKYESYSDEQRGGVLMLQRSDDAEHFDGNEDRDWQVRITTAFQSSVETVFPSVERKAAIGQVQNSLRTFAKGELLVDARKIELRDFFVTFRDSM